MEPMEWNRSETIALAKVSCKDCLGFGMRQNQRRRAWPCDCVFRAIFRACYRRFRECVSKAARTSTITLEWCGGSGGRRFYSRKVEEYVADFCLVSRRVLSESDYQIFKYHYLLGADWRLCCQRLQVDRGRFFHDLYRIQKVLGRTYRELKPYPLFPLDEYFGGVVRKAPVRSLAPPAPAGKRRARRRRTVLPRSA